MSVLEIPADQYHADELTDQPSLSSSIAKLLLTSSPRHAWTQHPRLNPNYERDTDDKFSIGICAHALLLEGTSRIEMVMADDWRTKLAREQRDEAYANGRIPLLAKNAADVTAMVEAARDQLAAHEATPPLFADGKPEQTLVWEDSGITCRARLDWLRNDIAACDDLKTTSRSANPESWIRSSLFSMGYDIQSAFYLRGIKAVTGAEPEFRFCVVETTPPYGLSVVALDPMALELANDKVQWAINRWSDCLEHDSWPGYPTRVCYAQSPGWAETQWLEKEAREVA